VAAPSESAFTAGENDTVARRTGGPRLKPASPINSTLLATRQPPSLPSPPAHVATPDGHDPMLAPHSRAHPRINSSANLKAFRGSAAAALCAGNFPPEKEPSGARLFVGADAPRAALDFRKEPRNDLDALKKGRTRPRRPKPLFPESKSGVRAPGPRDDSRLRCLFIPRLTTRSRLRNRSVTVTQALAPLHLPPPDLFRHEAARSSHNLGTG
jgi:hypothetical protein